MSVPPRHRHRHRAGRPVVRGLITLAVSAAIAGAGGMAYGSWATNSTSETFTLYMARIPRMDPPRVTVRTAPRIRWTPVELAPGVAMHRYVVTRHLGPVTQIVCDVPAAAAPRCTDRNAPAGYVMTYTVAATYGSRWVGPASEPSSPVTRPGVAVPLIVDGVTILPGPAGAVVVLPGAAPSTSAGVSAEQPSVPPTGETSTPADVVTVEPVRKPPPAPRTDVDATPAGRDDPPPPADDPATESGNTTPDDPPPAQEPDLPSVPLLAD
jgi:hypothetical protein